MNGAESLVRTLVASGVDVCFTNPGTSEMHFVAALDKVAGMRAILGLFEGAVTGMADGYGRMAGAPAATLLHLGPGLSNGAANLHNARRASTPIVNVVGDHATYHLQYDAPLTSDIASLARPVSDWLHTSKSARTVASDGARAVAAARSAPGQVATLVLPADAAWNQADGVAPPLDPVGPAPVSEDAVERVASLLSKSKSSAMLLRGAALRREALLTAGRIAAKTGTRLFCDTFAPRIERGAGIVAVERLPYFAEQIVDFLAGLECLVLVGARPPVAFFAYPEKPSQPVPEGCRVVHLSHPHEDGVAALEALADTLGASVAAPAGIAERAAIDAPRGGLDQFTAGLVIARHLPEGAIVSDEAATSSVGPMLATMSAAPHDHLALTGGSIGQGLPVATGAAVACPDRKVVCLHGDGGAMYTLQALWTQARERLDVTTVIFANRSYAILAIELARVGAETGGAKAASMFDLGRPDLDWVKLAQGMGVAADRVDSVERFDLVFEAAMKEKGPHLIEVVL